MHSSGRLSLALLALSTGIAPFACAQLAGTVEPFDFESNAQSWFLFDYADGENYFPEWDLTGDGTNPDIWAGFFVNQPLEFFALESSSNGAFTGDYTAGGVDAIGALIYIEDSAAVGLGEFFFYSTTDEQYHISPDYIPPGNGWNQGLFSLTEDPWFILEDGDYVESPLTPEILAGVAQIGFTFYPNDLEANPKAPSAVGTAIGLDSFVLFASLTPPPLLATLEDGQPVISFERSQGLQYDIIASTDLIDSAVAPGQENITGTGPYSFMPDLADPTQFFLLTLDDFLTPVEEVPAVVP